MSSEVTICSVITPFHTKLMVINYQLISLLNGSTSYPLKIVYNEEFFLTTSRKQLRVQIKKGKDYFKIIRGRRKIPKSGNQNKLLDCLPQNSIFDGPSLEHAFTRALETADKSGLTGFESELRALKSLASYHHALGIETAIEKVKTRFVVLIDPDFYVIQADWLNRIVSHMKQKKLAVFGAPWNPRWYQKFRDFPCTHLMIFDREKLRITDDIALPDLIGGGPKFISRFWMERAEEWNRARVFRSRSLVHHPWQALKEEWLQRRTIAASRDTGFKMRGLCQQLGLAFESLTPVFDPEVEGFDPPTVSPIQIHPLVQLLLPEDRVYLPKRSVSYSRSGFKERGFPNFRGIGWEEFMWHNEPFAFHVRGERRKVSGRDFLYLRNGLQTILGRQGLSPLPDVGPGEEDEYSIPLGLIESPKGLMQLGRSSA